MKCGYCGVECSQKYCWKCKAEKYDELHKATGRTNGWDKSKKKNSVSVESGWRGRPVIGGGFRIPKILEMAGELLTGRPTKYDLNKKKRRR